MKIALAFGVVSAAVVLQGCGQRSSPSPTPAPAVEPPPGEASTGPQRSFSFLQTRGSHIVDEAGRIVRLRGVNLGSWLLMEPWMIGIGNEQTIESEKDLWDTIRNRFGEDKTRKFIRRFRDTFITEADIASIAALGLNSVRLPVWWRVTDDPLYGEENFSRIDQCIEWCRKHGLYVILDLHGAPEGQNATAAINGESAFAGLWSSDDAKRRTRNWWKAAASRYRDEPVVAGYDLLNESIDADFETMLSFYDVLMEDIREIDDRHIIFLQDGLHGFHRLPRPADRGWSNVVYSFHFYPQNDQEGEMAVGRLLPAFHRTAMDLDVPVYVGEFNTIQQSRGGVEELYRYLQLFDFYGWSWSLWSYKKIEDNPDYNWGIAGYREDASFPKVTEAEADELEDAIRNLATKPGEKNPLLAAALGAGLFVPDDIGSDDEDMRWFDARTSMALPASRDGIRLEWQVSRPHFGFWGFGDSTAWKVIAHNRERHAVTLRMASTEDTIPLQVWINGVLARTLEIPGTGGWRTFEDRSLGAYPLETGVNWIEIRAGERNDAYINARALAIRPSPSSDSDLSENAIWLKPATITPSRIPRDYKIAWNEQPPHIGYWPSGTPVGWTIRLAEGGRYRALAIYSSPNSQSQLQIFRDREPLASQYLASSGGWDRFRSRDIGTFDLGPGEHVISVVWSSTNTYACGNLREIRLQRTGPVSGL